MYGLCDCNNFFASCERVFNPSLERRPVVVLSSNDGCIIARSNEAKKLGLKTGQPFFQARAIIKSSNCAVYSSNYTLYSDMSQRVMTTLSSLLPAIEVYSIDEAFLDFTGFDLSILAEKGREIARIVKRNTGVPVSIGIAPTKTLAKIGARLCKQYPKLNGCCFLHRPEDIEKVLKKLPIEDIWGIGRKYSKMLIGVGILSGYNFTQVSPLWVENKMGIVGLRIWKELRGESSIEFDDVNHKRKQISVSRSFAKEISDFNDLRDAVSTFTSMAAKKLRKQGSCAGELQVILHTNRFREDIVQQFESKQFRFDRAIDSTLELTKKSIELLEELVIKGYKYKKVGVSLLNIVEKNSVIPSFFDDMESIDKHSKLMKAIDYLNDSHGSNKVTLASQGLQSVKINKDYQSPRFTTNWGEILKIKV